MDWISAMTPGGWVPTLGDPSILGWMTVVSYFLTSILCFKCSLLSTNLFPKHIRERIRTFWIGLSGTLFFLGINKQFDLQTFVTEAARIFSENVGIYQYKRDLQLVFILSLAFLVFWVLSGIKRYTKSFYSQIKLPLLGLGALAFFILIRATSFHHVDQLIKVNLSGFTLNWIIEIGGILTIAFSAIQEIKTRNRNIIRDIKTN